MDESVQSQNLVQRQQGNALHKTFPNVLGSEILSSKQSSTFNIENTRK